MATTVGAVATGTVLAGQSTMPEIKSKHSLVHKYVTENLWDLYKNHKTETCGYTLE
jgi:hypothetical protein